MLIRSFQSADKARIIDVFRLNVPKFFSPKEVHDFEKYLSEHGETYLIIEQDGKIVGGTGYYINASDNTGRITWIFFHPDAKGHGFGKNAVIHCMKILKENKKVEKLAVWTSQFAYAFFEQFGFETVKTEADYWDTGLDLYLMEQPNC